jgi:neutral ceramidase
MKYTKAKSPVIKIQAIQDSIICPGRTRTNVGREGAAGTYTYGDPVHILLGVLMLNDIVLGTVNAEVYSPIAMELKKKSPYGKTIVVTITNGSANSGYIPSDEAFGRYTFQVLGSRLKEGCAQESIVNGLIGLMNSIPH